MAEPDPPRLSRSELKTWRRFTSSTQALNGVLDRHLRDAAGLSHIDFLTLSALSAPPHTSVRMNKLAEELSISRSRLSHAIGRMEHRGWVVRDASPEDGRGTEAHLTNEGEEVLRDAWNGHSDLIRQLIFDVLTPKEQRQLQDIMAKIGRAARGCE